MKKLRQGVRSTKLKENTRLEEENIPGNANAEVNPSPPVGVYIVMVCMDRPYLTWIDLC
jgi:hypothetical protein